MSDPQRPTEALVKSIAKATLHRLGYQLTRLPGPPDPQELWKNDAHFMSLMEQIRNHTLVVEVRCFMLYQFTKQVAGLSGDAAEVGVYKGGTAKLLAKQFSSQGKRIYLFDTFSGTPEVNPAIDKVKTGLHSDTSLEGVRDFLRDCDNVDFFPGFFPDTASGLEDRVFSFVHVDANLYRSVWDSYEFFYPRMVPGGVMINDDYAFLCCPGAKQATDEFFADKPEIPIHLPTGQCLIIKADPLRKRHE